MPTKRNHIVLPVSTLKERTSQLFDALANNITVYVSKRGEIRTAFQPFETLPEGIAAAYVSPFGKPVSEITARDLGRSVPSRQIDEAAEGLPSLLTKNGQIYGVLNRAIPPAPDVAPNPEVVGQHAEAVLAFQEARPDATFAEVMAFSDSWQPPELPELLSKAVVLEPDTVLETGTWPASGSRGDELASEPTGSSLDRLIETLIEVFARSWEGAEVPSGVFASLAEGPSSTDAFLAISEIYATVGTADPEIVAFGERCEMKNQLDMARSSYIAALITDSAPSIPALWRLGELARHEGRFTEASSWYDIALYSTPETSGRLKPSLDLIRETVISPGRVDQEATSFGDNLDSSPVFRTIDPVD